MIKHFDVGHILSSESWTIFITQVDFHNMEGKFKLFESEQEALDWAGIKQNERQLASSSDSHQPPKEV